MPLPAIVGASLIGGLIAKVAEKTIEVLFSRVFKKFAIIGVIAAAYFTAIYTLLNLGASYIASALAGMPSEISLIGLLLPSNASECISLIIGTEVAILTYSFAVKTFYMKLEVAR